MGEIQILSKKQRAVLSLNEDFGALQGRELELISRHLYLDGVVGSLLTQIYPPTHSYGQFFTAKVQSLRLAVIISGIAGAAV